MIRCTFVGNSSKRGGAVENRDDIDAVFLHCTFSDNSAKDNGGAMCVWTRCDVVLSNCVFGSNRVEYDAGAIAIVESTVSAMNCTISGNEAGQRHGGFVSGADSVLRMENCILWANVDARNGPGSELAQAATNGGEITMDYCCVEGLTGTLGGIGNIGSDPLLVDIANGDYHLRTQGRRWDESRARWTQDGETSPCIDAGNPGRALGDEPTATPSDPNSLPGTNPRIDMGAYGGTAEASMAPPQWMLLADITNDNCVDWLDLTHLAADWATMGESSAADLSRDGAVGGADLALLGSQWRHKAGSAAASTLMP